MVSDSNTINIIKNNYSELSNAEFIVEGTEMFAFVEHLSTVNPGDICKV